jgi:predicted metal-dependent phosphoesterase TrpH
MQMKVNNKFHLNLLNHQKIITARGGIIQSSMKEIIPEGYSLAVTHTHTTCSDGMVSPRELITAVAKKQDELETPIFVALTDHDTIKGLDEGYCASESLGVRLIAGQEVSAGAFPSKHILGYFEDGMTNPIARGKSPEATIDEIKSRNGLVVIAHADAFRGLGSLTSNEINELGNKENIDGIESINGTYDRRKQLKTLIANMRESGPVSEIGGTDSHFGEKDLLTALTLFKGKTVKELFEAIKNGATIPMVGVPHTVTTWDRIVQNLRSNIGLNFRRYVTKNL